MAESITKVQEVLEEDTLSFYQLIQVGKNVIILILDLEYLLQDFEDKGHWCYENLAVCSVTMPASGLQDTDTASKEQKQNVIGKARETIKIYDSLIKRQEQQEKNLEWLWSASVTIFQKSSKNFFICFHF